MISSWNDLPDSVGQIVDNVFPLTRFVHNDPDGSLFETTLEDGRTANIRLYPAELSDAKTDLEHWLPLTRLDHPNLLRCLAAGKTSIDGFPVIYVVKEKPEEALDDVLGSRSLTEDETREMLESVLRATGYLHARGFVHPGSGVFAVEDTLKVSIDSAIQSEPLFERIERDQDLLWIGGLVCKALTRQSPWDGDTLAIPPMPEPFATIVARCCDEPSRRWTLSQVSAALYGRPVVETAPEPDTTPIAAPTVPDPVAIPAALPVSEPPSRETPSRIPRTLASGPQRQTLETYEAKPERPRWIVPAAVAVLLVFILVVWSFSRSSKPSAPTGAPAPQAATTSLATPSAAPVTPQPLPPAKSARGSRKASSWYVVVATYAAREGAEHRAHEITRQFPHFAAHVFEPPVPKPHHLVVIGANLSEERAEDLRNRARAARVSRDIYIKRFPG